LTGWIPFRGQTGGEGRVGPVPRTLGRGLWGAGYGSLASPSSFFAFLGVCQGDRTPGGLPKQHHRRPRVCVARRFPLVLAWISPGASHGVSKDAPPSVWALDVHSCSVPPRLSLRLRLASACSRQGAGLVPSSWFPTTMTVSSVVRPAGLLHPAADPGVRRVAVVRALVPRHLRVPDLPRRSTLRSLSTPVAVRRVSTVLPDSCPPAVHRSFLLLRAKAARLQGFSPRDGFTGCLGPCGRRSRTASLGFFFSRCRLSGLLIAAPEGDGSRGGTPRSRRANRVGPGARCSFQPLRLAAVGLSRSAPSRTGPQGNVPCPGPHRDRPGRGLGRLWSSRVAGPVGPS
jgi:hypothetical protein